jgi:uncharacterized damage-inducible protein DinB
MRFYFEGARYFVMRLSLFSAAVVLAGCTVMGSAQMGTTSPAPAPGTMVAPSAAADAVLNIFEHEVVGVAKEMPADKFSFAPSAANFVPAQGAKYEGVRTFAEEIAHLTQANYYFFSLVGGGMKPDVDVKAIGSMTTKEQLIPALEASFAFGHRAIATLTPQNALEEIKGAAGIHTRLTMATFAVAHGFDHYGQMVEYLRMNGMVPPGSK